MAAHPEDDVDPFHTFFGLAGLSLLKGCASELSLQKMEVKLVLPEASGLLDVSNRLGWVFHLFG